MEITRDCRGYVGIMKKKMETTRDYRGYVRVFMGVIGCILGFYWINGKGYASYYLRFRVGSSGIAPQTP